MGTYMELSEAYFDASGTHGAAKDLCLAGYIFRKDAAIAFDEDWRRMLGKFGLPYFHMKECAHAKGVFKNLGNDPIGFGGQYVTLQRVSAVLVEGLEYAVGNLAGLVVIQNNASRLLWCQEKP